MKSLGRIVGILLVLFTLLSTFGTTQPVMAQSTEHWCGGTSETLNYGFSFPSGQVAHWTVNGEAFVSQATIDQVDVILDKLNADNIFVAEEVLAKHDENYMPPEAMDAIKKAEDAKAASGIAAPATTK